VIGRIGERESIRKADLDGRSPFDVDPAFVAEIAVIKERLQKEIGAIRNAQPVSPDGERLGRE
jgi:hypothetical protein